MLLLDITVRCGFLTIQNNITGSTSWRNRYLGYNSRMGNLRNSQATSNHEEGERRARQGNRKREMGGRERLPSITIHRSHYHRVDEVTPTCDITGPALRHRRLQSCGFRHIERDDSVHQYMDHREGPAIVGCASRSVLAREIFGQRNGYVRW